MSGKVLDTIVPQAHSQILREIPATPRHVSQYFDREMYSGIRSVSPVQSRDQNMSVLLIDLPQ